MSFDPVVDAVRALNLQRYVRTNEKHDLGAKPRSFDSVCTGLIYDRSATSVRSKTKAYLGSNPGL